MSSTEMDLAIQDMLEKDIPPNYINIVDQEKVFVGTAMVGNEYIYARLRDDPNGKTYDIYKCDENKQVEGRKMGNWQERVANDIDLIINHTDELRIAVKEIQEMIQLHVKQRIETKTKQEEERKREEIEREKKQALAERTMRNLMR